MKPVKLTIFLLIIILPDFLNAQNQKDRSDNKFSFGLSFSPDYTYRHLSMKNDEYNFVDLRNETDDPRFGFTTGLVTKYKLRERLALESGIQFSDRGERIQKDYNDWTTPDENVIIDPDPGFPDKFKSSYHYYYLGVPVKLNYYFMNGKTKMYASAGVAADYFVVGKNKVVIEFDNNTIKETNNIDENFNKVNIIGLVGVGIETNVSQRLTFRVEPTFRYSFTPVVDGDLKGYYYSAGINLVVLYH